MPFMFLPFPYRTCDNTTVLWSCDMSRHNRRRTRGNHKQSFLTQQSHQLESSEQANLAALDPFVFSTYPSASCPKAPSRPLWSPFTRGTTLSSRHWHNRYIAWQARNSRDFEEKQNAAADRQRIFGTVDGQEDGDADGLEEKMLHYFRGLEWLDA